MGFGIYDKKDGSYYKTAPSPSEAMQAARAAGERYVSWTPDEGSAKRLTERRNAALYGKK